MKNSKNPPISGKRCFVDASRIRSRSKSGLDRGKYQKRRRRPKIPSTRTPKKLVIQSLQIDGAEE
jgi:hypothetical protein